MHASVEYWAHSKFSDELKSWINSTTSNLNSNLSINRPTRMGSKMLSIFGMQGSNVAVFLEHQNFLRSWIPQTGEGESDKHQVKITVCIFFFLKSDSFLAVHKVIILVIVVSAYCPYVLNASMSRMDHLDFGFDFEDCCYRYVVFCVCLGPAFDSWIESVVCIFFVKSDQLLLDGK